METVQEDFAEVQSQRCLEDKYALGGEEEEMGTLRSTLQMVFAAADDITDLRVL